MPGELVADYDSSPPTSHIPPFRSLLRLALERTGIPSSTNSRQNAAMPEVQHLCRHRKSSCLRFVNDLTTDDGPKGHYPGDLLRVYGQDVTVDNGQVCQLPNLDRASLVLFP